MADLITGALFGAFITFAILHLLYKKIFTFKGWIDKEGNNTNYWVLTMIYFACAISSLLYMVYT